MHHLVIDMKHLIFSIFQNFVMGTWLGQYKLARKIDNWLYDWLKDNDANPNS